jgi:hypothetical protein
MTAMNLPLSRAVSPCEYDAIRYRIDDRKSEITIEGVCKTSSMPVLGVALSFTLNAATAYPSGSASVSGVFTITKIDEKGSNKGFTAVTITAIDYEGITPA